jgi:serine/threonine-protein kinase
LETGSRLGAFEILEPVGAGGMGAVYRARDTTLGRDVAIKALPETFARDAERLSRFEREARLLAALNHPGIATLHGLETHDDVRFIVMELVEGHTLAELLSRGPLTVDRARALFIQIADALAAAHERGIVHRDLKPANVMLTAEDRVKLLDFGLARSLTPRHHETLASQWPTETRDTEAGTVMGTAPYMSPEQARGEAVDARTDIWAFGCCLFEALTAKRAFDGTSTAEVLAGILEREPPLGQLPALPPGMEFVLHRCLEKSAPARLHSAADARLLLEDSGHHPPLPGADRRPGGAIPWVAAALVLGALAGALAVLVSGRNDRGAGPPEVVRFTIQRPAGTLPRTSRAMALSPDGRTMAWAEARDEGTTLYVRSMAEVEPRAILETASLVDPFFSPNGQSIGFFSGGQIKRIPVRGGTPQTLGEAGAGRGGCWGDDGLIYVGDILGGISALPEEGGTPITVTRAEPIERRHRWPSALPGGRGILYAEGILQDFEASRIMVKPTGERARVVIDHGTAPVYVPTGHLVYARDGALMAAGFDLERLQVVGSPAPVLETVLHDRSSGAAQYAVAANGSLFYASGDYGEVDNALVWVDRDGRESPLALPPRHYRQPRLSPDERKLAVGVGGENENVWVYDLEDRSATRLTFEGENGFPVWTPDGARIAFQSQRTGRYEIFWKPADGSARAEQLTYTDAYVAPHAFTPDGTLLVVQATAPRATDILLRPPGGGEMETFIATAQWENSPVVSPDGRFVAYRTNDTGSNEIYVQTLPSTGARWQVSTGGGSEALWSRDGRTLFYRAGRKMMAVPVTTEPSFHSGRPEILFEGEYARTVPDRTNYDVTADGRLLMVKTSEGQRESRDLVVVLHWASELPSHGASVPPEARPRP